MEACILDLYGDKDCYKFLDLLVDCGEEVLNTLEAFAIYRVRIKSCVPKHGRYLASGDIFFFSLEVRLCASRLIVKSCKEPTPHCAPAVRGSLRRRHMSRLEPNLTLLHRPREATFSSNSISRLGSTSRKIIGRPLSIIPAGRMMH